MGQLEEGLEILGEILQSRKNRHIIGGVLLSLSVFFGGLAVTVMTINKVEEKKNE